MAGELHTRRRCVPHRPGKRRRGGRRNYSWAELLRRMFAIEVFRCPSCGGTRRLLVAIQDPVAIKRVLRAIRARGLPCAAPEMAPARAPTRGELEWFGTCMDV